MGCKRETRPGKYLGKETVADLLGSRFSHNRLFREAADPFQRAGDSLGVARELHGGSIGQKLALPTDAGLDQAAE